MVRRKFHHWYTSIGGREWWEKCYMKEGEERGGEGDAFRSNIVVIILKQNHFDLRKSISFYYLLCYRKMPRRPSARPP